MLQVAFLAPFDRGGKSHKTRNLPTLAGCQILEATCLKLVIFYNHFLEISNRGLKTTPKAPIASLYQFFAKTYLRPLNILDVKIRQALAIFRLFAILRVVTFVCDVHYFLLVERVKLG